MSYIEVLVNGVHRDVGSFAGDVGSAIDSLDDLEPGDVIEISESNDLSLEEATSITEEIIENILETLMDKIKDVDPLDTFHDSEDNVRSEIEDKLFENLRSSLQSIVLENIPGDLVLAKKLVYSHEEELLEVKVS